MRGYDDIELEVRGLTLRARRYHTEGASDAGTPVLALHGWIDNAGTFARVAASIPRPLVALDLPGHGLSDHRPENAEYHYVNWVVDALGALDALGWDRAALLGHSMGAGVCALLAGAAPERVERLAMVEGLGPFTTSALAAPENLGRAWQGRRFDRTPRLYPTREEVVARKRAASPGFTEEAIAALMERGIVEVEGEWRFSHDPRLKERSILRLTEAHVLAFFRNVACPTLFVRASNGLAYDVDVMRRRMEALSNLELVEVEGNHHVHLIDPHLVEGHLRRFFA